MTSEHLYDQIEMVFKNWVDVIKIRPSKNFPRLLTNMSNNLYGLTNKDEKVNCPSRKGAEVSPHTLVL